MEPSDELISTLRREEIARGRAMPADAKVLAGAELFDYACKISEAGIRHQYPEFDDSQVLAELRRRIRIGERVRSMSYDGG